MADIGQASIMIDVHEQIHTLDRQIDACLAQMEQLELERSHIKANIDLCSKQREAALVDLADVLSSAALAPSHTAYSDALNEQAMWLQQSAWGSNHDIVIENVSGEINPTTLTPANDAEVSAALLRVGHLHTSLPFTTSSSSLSSSSIPTGPIASRRGSTNVLPMPLPGALPPPTLTSSASASSSTSSSSSSFISSTPSLSSALAMSYSSSSSSLSAAVGSAVTRVLPPLAGPLPPEFTPQSILNIVVGTPHSSIPSLHTTAAAAGFGTHSASSSSSSSSSLMSPMVSTLTTHCSNDGTLNSTRSGHPLTAHASSSSSSSSLSNYCSSSSSSASTLNSVCSSDSNPPHAELRAEDAHRVTEWAKESLDAAVILALRDAERGISLTDHRTLLTNYHCSFTGVDFVNWTISEGWVAFASDAHALGTRLCAKGMLKQS